MEGRRHRWSEVMNVFVDEISQGLIKLECQVDTVRYVIT